MFMQISLVILTLTATVLSQQEQNDQDQNIILKGDSSPSFQQSDTELGSSSMLKLSDGRRRLLLKRIQLRSKQNSTTTSGPFLRVRIRPLGFGTTSPTPSFGDKHSTTPSPAFITSTISPAPLIEEPHNPHQQHHNNQNSQFSQFPLHGQRHEPGSFFLPRPMLEDYEDYELFGLPQPHPWNPMFHPPKQQHQQLMQAQRRAFDISMGQIPRRFSQEQLSLNAPNLIPLTPASGPNNQNAFNTQSQFDGGFNGNNFNGQQPWHPQVSFDGRFGPVDNGRRCSVYH